MGKGSMTTFLRQRLGQRRKKARQKRLLEAARKAKLHQAK